MSAHDAAGPVTAPDGTGSTILARRLLNVALFVTIVLSSLAFIEPSPHDALMLALVPLCAAAHVSCDRRLVPLFILIIIWLLGGFLALIPVGDQKITIQYAATSLYLGVAALIFACLFCEGDLTRLRILRNGYVVAALLATAAGYAGFFHLGPHSDVFLSYGRVSATFKDPNVYGPYLIFPLLLLIVGFMTRGVRVIGLLVTMVLLGGLFLSFSRGAWIHFGLSAAVATLILFAVTPDPRMRYRIVLLTVAAGFVVALVVLALLSVGSVHDLFLVRARAIQPYDVGPAGRFGEQQLALSVILDHPNGLGPFEFGRLFGLQQHDVYMQGFLVYGWLGGAAYLTLVLVTLAAGIRAAIVSTPWQYYLIAAYGAFVGEAVEGFIVDTDHWRHFFLLLGLIWGLTAATVNYCRVRPWEVEGAAAMAPAAI